MSTNHYQNGIRRLLRQNSEAQDVVIGELRARGIWGAPLMALAQKTTALISEFLVGGYSANATDATLEQVAEIAAELKRVECVAIGLGRQIETLQRLYAQRAELARIEHDAEAFDLLSVGTIPAPGTTTGGTPCRVS